MVTLVKIYATHQTAIIWYLHPPNDTSYYQKTIDESELCGEIYINKN